MAQEEFKENIQSTIHRMEGDANDIQYFISVVKWCDPEEKEKLKHYIQKLDDSIGKLKENLKTLETYGEL